VLDEVELHLPKPMFGFCLLAMRISRGTSQSGSRMESGNAGSMLFFCGGGRDGGGNGRGRVVGRAPQSWFRGNWRDI